MKEIVFWNNTEYRIKPEQKYRPFANVEECWQELLKHKPFGWVKEKYSDRYNLIIEVNGLSIKVKEGCLFADGISMYNLLLLSMVEVFAPLAQLDRAMVS